MMARKDECKKDTTPIIKITLLNYDPGKQDEYSQKFMLPLIEGLVKRICLAQVE